MANCGADTEANLLLASLTTDAVFPIPDVDLSGIVFPADALNAPVTALTLAALTTGTVDGTGAYETLMRGFQSHLTTEFDANRITGDDYTKAYIALTEAAMSQGANFLLQKDTAYWQALMIKVQAFTAQVQFETAKIQLAEAQYSASNQKAQYALTKMQIATQEVTYCTAKYNLEQMMPAQLINLGYQGDMLKEQTEAQRAQTLDIRSDGAAVVGVLGKQKALYAQQITSYQRDAELKAARIWSDAWITQKTIDEGLLAPPILANDSVNDVLETIKTNNNL